MHSSLFQMLKTRNIGAYRDLLLLFTRYGRKDFRLSMTPEDVFAPEQDTEVIEPDVRARAEAFAAALKKMGPTYVKFGQLLSTRPDIVPHEYILALESLQDDLPAFSFADVEKIVEDELGVRISKAFGLPLAQFASRCSNPETSARIATCSCSSPATDEKTSGSR